MDSRGDSSTFNQSSAIATEASKHRTRSLLPAVKMHLRNRHYEYTAIGLLDSVSEIHIMSSNYCNRLQLVGVPVIVNIVCAGGVVVRKKTKKVEVSVKDVCGVEKQVECIVLDQACGSVLPINKELLREFDNLYILLDQCE